MPLDPSQRPPLMCLTQDGVGERHCIQAERLCAAGARWIQLRMKGAPRDAWIGEATEAAAVCRRHGAILIVNDSAEVALLSGAHGAHLGKSDGDWRAARAALGPGAILGGTVNTPEDAARAVASGCLDYAGVGPLRFTSTKDNLSPVRGLDGVGRLAALLGGIPAWAIGGVQVADMAALRAAGLAGAAVSSALHRAGGPGVAAFLAAWESGLEPATIS